MKDIKGYEGLYAVTSCGKVWSYRHQKFLVPWNNGYGYLYVALRKDGRTQKYKVHRLIAEAYIPNPDNKPQVNHKDEVKTHNWVGNLEWMTAKENMNYGSRNAKTWKPVYCVELRREFESQKAASLATGVSQSGISSACRGRIKTAGGYHWEFVNVEDLKR